MKKNIKERIMMKFNVKVIVKKKVLEQLISSNILEGIGTIDKGIIMFNGVRYFYDGKVLIILRDNIAGNLYKHNMMLMSRDILFKHAEAIDVTEKDLEKEKEEKKKQQMMILPMMGQPFSMANPNMLNEEEKDEGMVI